MYSHYSYIKYQPNNYDYNIRSYLLLSNDSMSSHIFIDISYLWKNNRGYPLLFKIVV